jgi:hypothetical protein
MVAAAMVTAAWSRRQWGCDPGARSRHSPEGAQPRDNRRRRCQPTRGNEILCPRVVRSTRCDRWVMSYAPGIFPCSPSIKRAGQRPSGVWSVAPNRTDSGRFHGVLFPNLFPNEPACQPLSSHVIQGPRASLDPHCQGESDCSGPFRCVYRVAICTAR